MPENKNRSYVMKLFYIA